MLPHIHFQDDKPIPHLADRVAQHKKEGGRLVLYRRAWSAVVVTVTQDRIEHVPSGSSRVLAGWRHVLFTLLLGPWSLLGFITVPMLLILNLRGGVDVTARFSETSIDPLRSLPPDPEQARRDVLVAQWTFVTLGLLVLIPIFYLFSRLSQ